MTEGQRLQVLEMTVVSKEYLAGGRTFPVLRDINLTISKGEVVCVLGRSGSGMTTLLSLAGCLDRPDQGAIVLDGTEISRLSDRERYRLRKKTVGWVLQNSGLLPLLTAAENVALALRIQGVEMQGCIEPALFALGELGLSARANHRTYELSGGEMQRVALARALVKRPALLLADEPTGALDSEGAHEIASLIRNSAKSGMSVLMATHDVGLIQFADRVVTITDCQLRDGTAEVALNL